MISNHDYKYKYAKKIGKEAQVLIINHLLQEVQKQACQYSDSRVPIIANRKLGTIEVAHTNT